MKIYTDLYCNLDTRISSTPHIFDIPSWHVQNFGSIGSPYFKLRVEKDFIKFSFLLIFYKMFTRCTLYRHAHMLINCNSQHLGLDSFTASLHSICQPAIRDIQGTVSGLWKIEEIPTGHMSS